MNCIYNDEIELVCVNESMMSDYMKHLVAVTEQPLNEMQNMMYQLREQSMRNFCGCCLAVQRLLWMKEIKEELSRLRVTGLQPT